MSEFKFACPVCGQHMMCDTSQAGSVMDCPTCFQKIVSPQAPSADSKFILTGTKLTEKKISVRGVDGPVVVEKKFPVGLVIALVVALAALGAGVAFRGKIFKSSGSNPPPDQVTTSPNNPAPPAKPEKPAPVAPPASDTNWSLDLGTNAIPDAVVAGRIHGQDFILERCTFSTNGTLTIRAGTRGQVEFGALISFTGAQAESLSGQSINVMSNADRAARVQLRWKDQSGTIAKEDYSNGYAMRIEFGLLANNRLPGRLYLCTPDNEKSYLMGTFTADARKPKPKVPKS